MMRSTKLQLIILGVVLCGAANARADESSFAAMDIALPGGRALHAQASEMALRAEPLVLAGEGFQVTFTLPKDVAPGTRVELPAMLHSAQQLQEGRLILEVNEAGAFLTGRITGTFGPLTVSGAIHVRRVSAALTLPVSANAS